jgi:uncharacterized OsmC-like protein
MTIDPERLDELLAREPYLDDDGFTARVVAGLPPRRRDPRPLVLGLAGAAAAVAAALVLPELVQAALAAVAALREVPGVVSPSPGHLLGAAAAVATAVVAAVIAAAEA